MEERREEEQEGEDPRDTDPAAPSNNSQTRPSQQTRSLKTPAHRNKIKWPKSNETEEWRRLDEHLSGLLQRTLRGPVEAKLNLFGV